MKKLFALLAVFTLAAVGCEDKKSTGKPSSATQGGTFVKTDTVKHESTAHVTNTVVQHTAAVTETKTVEKTVTVNKTPDKGPGLPNGDKKRDGGK